MFFKKANKPRSPSVGMQTQAHTESVEPSYIGRDMVMEGQINCEGELHIDGSFRGTVRARGSPAKACVQVASPTRLYSRAPDLVRTMARRPLLSFRMSLAPSRRPSWRVRAWIWWVIKQGWKADAIHPGVQRLPRGLRVGPA